MCLSFSRHPACYAAKPQAGRAGFTLIELMVSMALTLFVMVILTQAFVTSLETFSQLKSLGELQANLRTVSSLLQSDLAQDHFEGKRRLSSPDLLTLPPQQGFFYIYQGSPWTLNPSGSYVYVNEGNESTLGNYPPAGLQSYRAGNHVLYFTIKLRGNRPEDFMTATVPASTPTVTSPLLSPTTTFFSQPSDAVYLPQNNANTNNTTAFFSSQWAEVCYFLVQTGSTSDPSNPSATSGIPLYALYRAQYLLVPNPKLTSASNPTGPPPLPNPIPTIVTAPLPPPPIPYANISTYLWPLTSTPQTMAFNSPDSVAQFPKQRTLWNLTTNSVTTPPTRSSNPTPQGASPSTPASGSTLVLSNVTSFQVQVFTQPAGATAPPAGADFTDLLSAFPAYDTSNTNNPYNILAIQVTIRIWDSASQMSRQVTIMQDM